MYLEFQNISLNGDEVHEPFTYHKPRKNQY